MKFSHSASYRSPSRSFLRLEPLDRVVLGQPCSNDGEKGSFDSDLQVHMTRIIFYELLLVAFFNGICLACATTGTVLFMVRRKMQLRKCTSVCEAEESGLRCSNTPN